MTKVLTEMDGLAWREKLPETPAVPMEVRERLAQQARQSSNTPKQQHNGARDVPGTQ